MSHPTIERLSNHLKSIEHQKDQLKSLLKANSNPSIISYFAYSINYSHQGSNNLIIGHFIIHNLGTKELKNPYLCLQLPESGVFQLTGKIVSTKQKQKVQVGAWERFTEEGPSTTYWLRPVNQNKLAPGDKVTFSNFQIKWQSAEPYKGAILAYVYTDDMPDGLPALNSISVSGN
ncbi:hypothetical protein ACTWQB_06050 [Piscibacillus sp. B03]|uniref:hypothetical protein n=1 Tax=Piscibacillus sp. B03 TaxID=3457430 RepID=UPI003FCE0BB7